MTLRAQSKKRGARKEEQGLWTTHPLGAEQRWARVGGALRTATGKRCETRARRQDGARQGGASGNGCARGQSFPQRRIEVKQRSTRQMSLRKGSLPLARRLRLRVGARRLPLLVSAGERGSWRSPTL
jgi:hypothetical protein